MSEPRDGVSPEGPPKPPRWKGVQSLDLVYQLNERCMELLSKVAASDACAAALPIVAENRDLWSRLECEPRRIAARLPFVVLDVHFADQGWWQRVTSSCSEQRASEARCKLLPPEASEQLMHETVMFAWQTARWDRTVAQMVLGMSRSVAELISSLTPRQILAIATRESQSIGVRWANDPRFWRDLLLAAQTGNDERLADVQLHAKLLFCSELARSSM